MSLVTLFGYLGGPVSVVCLNLLVKLFVFRLRIAVASFLCFSAYVYGRAGLFPFRCFSAFDCEGAGVY